MEFLLIIAKCKYLDLLSLVTKIFCAPIAYVTLQLTTLYSSLEDYGLHGMADIIHISSWIRVR